MLHVPDVFEIPDPRDGKLATRLTAVVVTAMVLGTTIALVALSYMPDTDF